VGVFGTCCVCTGGTKAYIADEVHLGNDRQAVPCPAVVLKGVRKAVYQPSVGVVEDLREIGLFFGGVGHGVHAPGEKLRPIAHIGIEFVPHPPPGRVAPRSEILGEVIAGGGARSAVLRVVASNGDDALVVTVASEQFLAEGEKRRVRETIVLQDDGLFNALKHPIEAAAEAAPAAEVPGRIMLPQVAGPIDTIDEGARRRYPFRVSRAVGARPVGEHEHLPGTCVRDGRQHPLRELRSVEDYEDNGSFERQGPIPLGPAEKSRRLVPRQLEFVKVEV